MKTKENLLVDCKLKAIRQRLEMTLANMEFQKGVMMWDDEEKIEHCIEALKIMESENELSVKQCEKAVKQLKEYYGIDARIYGDSVFIAVWNEALSDTIDIEVSPKQVDDFAYEFDNRK